MISSIFVDINIYKESKCIFAVSEPDSVETPLLATQSLRVENYSNHILKPLNSEEANWVTSTGSRHVDDKGDEKITFRTQDYTTKTDSDSDRKLYKTIQKKKKKTLITEIWERSWEK